MLPNCIRILLLPEMIKIYALTLQKYRQYFIKFFT